MRRNLALGIGLSAGGIAHLWQQRQLESVYKYLGLATGLRDVLLHRVLPQGGVLEIPAFDPYWAPALVGGRPYEPEVHAAIEYFRTLRPVLVDGGANIGYWSAVCSHGTRPYTSAIAVEASPHTFARLQRNAALNKNRFEAVHAALSDTAGLQVFLELTEFPAMTRVGGRSGVAVETVTIDVLLQQRCVDEQTPVVAKLDVEGHEIAALRGATQLRARDHAFIVEDFEANGLATVSWLLEHDESVWYVNSAGRVFAVRDLAKARSAIAHDVREAASRNFVAVLRGGAFERLLAGLQRG